MRLFYALLRRRNMPNGHIYRGKDRLVKPVLWEHMQKLRNDFEREERNMFLLRHPYLTPEQSFGHAKALGKPEARVLALKQKVKEFKSDVTLESRLGHMRCSEAWE